MKNFKYIMIVLFGGILLSSCAGKMPLMVTANKIGSKTGVASRTIWLGISLGHTDLGLLTAAKNGGINKIATVDMRIKSGFLNTTFETHVTGE